MTRQLFLICAGSGLSAILCAIQYLLIRRGRFHRNPFIGLTSSATRKSDEAWVRGHRAAAPWLARSGALCAVGSVVAGCGLAFARDGAWATVFAIGGGVPLLLAIVLVTFVAKPAADRAAESAEA